mmetsp:Transcript_74565/g.139225  ORF Transcript_74565/g.139225 Transcript_74565/m.139225 type:complete len:103 (+) Transcript_74565:86-394(+)
MARRSSSSMLAIAFAVAVLYASFPAMTSFVGARGPASTPLRGMTNMGQTMESRVSMSAAPGGAGGPPTRINLAFLGFVAGMAVLGLLAAFFYGSYVGLGSSL